MPGNDPIASVDRSHLPGRDVLHLRLWNLERRLQAIGLRDLRQNSPRRHAHPDLERRGRGPQLRQSAFHSGTDGQLFHLFLLQLIRSTQLFDENFLSIQLCLDGLAADIHLLLRQRIPAFELLPFCDRQFRVELRLQTELAQLRVAVRL